MLITSSASEQTCIIDSLEFLITRARTYRQLPPVQPTAAPTPPPEPPRALPNDSTACRTLVTNSFFTIPPPAKDVRDTPTAGLTSNLERPLLSADANEIPLRQEPAVEPPSNPDHPSPAADVPSDNKRATEDSVEAPRRKRVKKDREPRQLVDLSLDLTEKIPVPTLVDRRNDFHQQLLDMVLPITRDRIKENVRFSTLEAVQVTNFLFEDIVGRAAYNRAAEIVNFYRSHRQSPDLVAAARATVLADTTTVPDAVRAFCHSFAERKKDNLTNPSYKDFLKHNAGIKMWHRWDELRQLAKAKDPGLVQFLNSQGLFTSQGADYRTLVTKYLMTALDIPSLVSDCQQAHGLVIMAEHFGNAVTLLLPGSTHRR